MICLASVTCRDNGSVQDIARIHIWIKNWNVCLSIARMNDRGKNKP